MYIYDEKSNTWIALRDTQAYKRKRRQARDYWIAALLIMTILPLGAVIFLMLLMTFLTFTYLDESLYRFQEGDWQPPGK